MAINKIRCPKCSSTNIRESAEYAPSKPEGHPAKKIAYTTPNYCLDCENEWY